MKQLFKLLLNYLPLEVTNFIYRISLRRIHRDKNAKELSYYVSKKKNTKEKYVVLRFANTKSGIFAIMRKLVFTMDYWEKRHFIPVVDFEYKDYFTNGMLGEHNIWDQCFKQTKSVKEVLNAEYVFVEDLSRQRAMLKTCMDINGNCNSDTCDIVELKKSGWREYYKKVNQYLMKWLVKSDAVENILVREFYPKKTNQETILGVMMREEFSKEAYQLMPEGRKKIMDKHPRVPDIDETIEIVDQYIKRYDINKIFLSTLHTDTIEKFQNRFGDKVFFVERARTSMDIYKINQFELSNSEAREEMKNDWGDTETEIPVKYVSEIYALAECDYLLGAPSGGMVGALMINGGKYKDIEILEDFNRSKYYNWKK